jgi:acetate kinase
MKILACNVGSTSLKFKLYDMPEARLLVEAKIERVGSLDDAIFRYGNPSKAVVFKKEKQSVPDYVLGIRLFLDALTSPDTGALNAVEELEIVSFKTVLAKGFYGVHPLTEEVMVGMRDYMDIAGSHNGPYISAIEQFKNLLPGAKMVGVFETAFHQTIPIERLLYGIPYSWYETYGFRKMGYHGASHGYISGRIGGLSGEKFRLISCHLGGSNSICAVLDGKSVDTSFGISLQTGVMHGSRTGDADTSLVPFLLGRGLSMEEIQQGLTKQGGILGISGVSDDLRYVEQAALDGNDRARLALDVYCSNIIHYIGAYYADLGGLDYLTFTGGIGENSHIVRQKVCSSLKHMGIVLDEEKNQAGPEERVISAPGSPVTIYVIPTNEEVYIARRAWDYLDLNK